MKLAITTEIFPKVYRAYVSKSTPAYITGINEVYRAAGNAPLTPGWQPLDYRGSEITTPEEFKKLLKSLQKSGVHTVNLKIETDGVNEPNNPDFKIKELI